MSSDLNVLPLAPDEGPLHTLDRQPPGYPLHLVVSLTAVLALAVLWLVSPVDPHAAWVLTAAIGLAAFAVVAWRTGRPSRACEQDTHMLAALVAATAEVPAALRTRMPLLLVTGDGLQALFDRSGQQRYAHVGNGAIWLRADEPQELPRLAVAARQWRNGQPPDGILLSVAPALHPDAGALARRLHAARQAAIDAAHRLGGNLPSYVAVYQRLTAEPPSLAAPRWYGVSSATPLRSNRRFDTVTDAAQDEVRQTRGGRVAAVRAASLAAIVEWTERAVLTPLADRQSATSWPLYGACWIDYGPASTPGTAWDRHVEMQTDVTPAPTSASPLPWPLPQPLAEAMPRRVRPSPRLSALAHALTVLACAASAAFWAAAENNAALLERVNADLARYSATPSTEAAARRDTWQTLVADRDELARYARTGVPLRLSFGMYQGQHLIPPLNDAIASYRSPTP